MKEDKEGMVTKVAPSTDTGRLSPLCCVPTDGWAAPKRSIAPSTPTEMNNWLQNHHKKQITAGRQVILHTSMADPNSIYTER